MIGRLARVLLHDTPMVDPVILPAPPCPEAEHLVDELRGQLVHVPAALAVATHSPAVLSLLKGALCACEQMSLSPRLREAIGLRVAALRGCPRAQLSETALCTESTAEYRKGRSPCSREHMLLSLVGKVVRDGGRHLALVVDSARELGVTDREMVEAITLVSIHDLLHHLASAGGEP